MYWDSVETEFFSLSLQIKLTIGKEGEEKS